MRRILEMLRLARFGLRRARLRSCLTALGVAIAVGALVSFMGYIEGTQRQLEKVFGALGAAHRIEVSSRVEDGKERSLYDGDLAELTSLRGVEHVYSQVVIKDVHVRSATRGPDKEESALALSLPDDPFAKGIIRDFLVSGTLPNPTAHEAVISTDLSNSIGIGDSEEALGASVTLCSTILVPSDQGNFSPVVKAIQVSVVGLVRVPYYVPQWSGRVIVLPGVVLNEIAGLSMSEAVAHRSEFEESRFDQVVVVLQSASDYDKVMDALRERGFTTRSNREEILWWLDYFGFLRLVAGGIAAIAFIVAGLGIMNAFFMSVVERNWELGLIRSFGATRADLVWILLGESLGIGAVGGLFGVSLGCSLSWIFQSIVMNAAPDLSEKLGFSDGISIYYFSPWLLGGAVLFAITLSGIAAVLPALRGARIDAIEALRRG